MTHLLPHQHYTEAESILDHLGRCLSAGTVAQGDPADVSLLLRAIVHATLAAAPRIPGDTGGGDHPAPQDSRTAHTPPAPAQA